MAEYNIIHTEKWFISQEIPECFQDLKITYRYWAEGLNWSVLDITDGTYLHFVRLTEFGYLIKASTLPF